MKMLSLKNLIGLGAIGGAMYYARKHGGFKNAFNELVGKAKIAKDERVVIIVDHPTKGPMVTKEIRLAAPASTGGKTDAT